MRAIESDDQTIEMTLPKPEDDGKEVKGVVKWFDAVKGYGFIIPEDHEGDVLLHFSALKDLGRRSVPEGATIDCVAVQRPKGRQAVKVVNLDLSTATAPDKAVERVDGHCHGSYVPPPEDAVYEKSVVKWFNRSRGYGFVSLGEGLQDVFIHIEVLRHSGLEELQPGEQVQVCVGDGERGQMVVALKPLH
jgi:CspA family cold shock protein